MINSYKWVKVVRKDYKKSNPKVNGSYSKKKNTITLYDRFFKLEEDVQASILEHEYSHYIWYRLPLIIQSIWWMVSIGNNIMLKASWYKKNAYVTEYAKTKITEDWAECIEVWYLLSNKYKGKKFWTYADFKIKVANKIYNHYSKLCEK